MKRAAPRVGRSVRPNNLGEVRRIGLDMAYLGYDEGEYVRAELKQAIWRGSRRVDLLIDCPDGRGDTAAYLWGLITESPVPVWGWVYGECGGPVFHVLMATGKRILMPEARLLLETRPEIERLGKSAEDRKRTEDYLRDGRRDRASMYMERGLQMSLEQAVRVMASKRVLRAQEAADFGIGTAMIRIL